MISVYFTLSFDIFQNLDKAYRDFHYNLTNIAAADDKARSHDRLVSEQEGKYKYVTPQDLYVLKSLQFLQHTCSVLITDLMDSLRS